MVDGATHTAKRSIDQLLCLWGAPLPPYIKEQGREAAGQGGGCAKRGSPTPTGSRTPPFLVGVGEGKGEGEGRKGEPPP